MEVLYGTVQSYFISSLFSLGLDFPRIAHKEFVQIQFDVLILFVWIDQVFLGLS
jgi:hypothetical protein